jgi:ubiquinone/menaquinone biosynthesis C-methylase UbiE
VSFYESRILPYLIHLSLRQESFTEYRQRVVPAAEGRVLEIGVGSGLNFRFYTDRAERVIGLDPSPQLLSMSRKATNPAAVLVDLLEASAESMPLEDHAVDTIVTTWSLCTIPDVQRALGEMRRVLRPGGRLLFVEHGRSPDDNVGRWQDRLTPLWRRIGGGCHLNRPIDQLLQASGFSIERMDTGYMKGPRLMTYMYEGSARRA